MNEPIIMRACEVCKTSFRTKKSRLEIGKGRFCSIACWRSSQRDADKQASRFWSKVRVAGPDECWLWTGERDSDGYGRFWNIKRNKPAHRFAFELANGVEVGRDCVVCHHCDNPPCCNPRHLFQGTHLDNVQDKISKGRLVVPDGEAHSRAKLTRDDVLLIRAAGAAGPVNRSELGRQFGVTSGTICDVLSGRTWKSA